jgi:triosephosphate isomerase
MGEARVRRPFIAGNWKMYLTVMKAVELAEAIAGGVKDVPDRDVLICPGFPLLSDVAKAIEGSAVKLGAQNLYCEREGAFTGEVSADMLLSVSCTHALIGHSERRHVFHEGDELVNRKVLFALGQGIAPVLCVGELLEEREAGRTEAVVKEQVVKGLGNVAREQMGAVTIAYEPVWAIGTGRTATPEDADGVHAFIRGLIAGLYGSGAADALRILYGGSVKPENIDGLMRKDNIDGVLVGGASLKADSFMRIVQFK